MISALDSGGSRRGLVGSRERERSALYSISFRSIASPYSLHRWSTPIHLMGEGPMQLYTNHFALTAESDSIYYIALPVPNVIRDGNREIVNHEVESTRACRGLSPWSSRSISHAYLVTHERLRIRRAGKRHALERGEGNSEGLHIWGETVRNHRVTFAAKSSGLTEESLTRAIW